MRDRETRLARFREERERAGMRVLALEPLVGDASERSYYRVHREEGSDVLALLPGSFDPEDFPFVQVARLFERIPLRVPRIQWMSGPEGMLLLEDLGDELLQKVAGRAGAREKRGWYEEAVRTLVRLQKRGAELFDERLAPYRLAFDEEKLHQELDFFRKHFLMGLRGARLTDAEANDLDARFRQIASELSARPRVLCHRDYHARNLLVVRGELAVIDFQDARLGPVSYDLVSLIGDSYVEHDAEFVAEMNSYFARCVGARDLHLELDLMALQRNLKALGTFGYQIRVKGREVYRRYVPFTLGLVRANLERNAPWDGLRRILSAHLPELG